MKNFTASIPGLNLSLAVTFLQGLADPPWRLVTENTLRSFGATPSGAIEKWVRSQQSAHRTVLVLPPTTAEGQHLYVVARLPLSATPASILPPPQFIVVADDFTLLWRLADPVSEQQARAMGGKLVAAMNGREAVGEPVPLPGTILFKDVLRRLVQRFPVHLLRSPAMPAYQVRHGALVPKGSASPQVKGGDPRLLSVGIGEQQGGGTVAWQPGQQSNGFCLILGSAGSGKTETLKVIGKGIHDYGVPVLVLDFHGDVALPGVRSVLLSSGPASTHGLNPLELDTTSAAETGLYDQRAALREMIMRAVPSLGHRQSDALREAVDEAYARAGITDVDPATWDRSPPTFADLLQVLGEMASAEGRRAAAADGLIAGVRDLFGHPIFQRIQHITIEDMLKQSMRLDLSRLPDGVRFIAAETLLRRVFRVLRMRGPIPVAPANDKERFRLFVVVDEAKILSLGGTDRDRNVLDDLFTEARKFGLGMVLASQMAEHFSDAVTSNAATWLVLKPQAMAEAKRNAPNVGVTPDNLMALNGRGDGYYRDRQTPRACRIQVQPLGGKG